MLLFLRRRGAEVVCSVGSIPGFLHMNLSCVCMGSSSHSAKTCTRGWLVTLSTEDNEWMNPNIIAFVVFLGRWSVCHYFGPESALKYEHAAAYNSDCCWMLLSLHFFTSSVKVFNTSTSVWCNILQLPDVAAEWFHSPLLFWLSIHCHYVKWGFGRWH